MYLTSDLPEEFYTRGVFYLEGKMTLRASPRFMVAILFLMVSAATPLRGQNPVPEAATPATPVRDAQAIALVQKSIAAMGGNAVGNLLNAQVRGTLAPAANSSSPAGSFTWTDDFSGPQFEFRHELDAADATRVLVSGHGSPAYQKAGKLKPLRSHVTYTALPYHLPAVVLARVLANANFSADFVGQVTVEGRPALQVVFKDNTDPVAAALSEQRWDFDPGTGLPLRIEYRLPNTIYADVSVPAAVELSNFQLVSGILVPLRIAVFEDGQPVSVVTISSIAFNVSVSPTQFDLAAGAQ